MEERRGLRTTYDNLNRWFDGSKECLIRLGFAKNKPIKVIDMFAGHDLPFLNLDSDFFERSFKYSCWNVFSKYVFSLSYFLFVFPRPQKILFPK